MNRYSLALVCVIFVLSLASNDFAQAKERSAPAPGDEAATAVVTSETRFQGDGKLLLSGRVLSQSNVALHGVWVVLDGDSLAEPRKVLTDGFGNFAFDNISRGESYVLNIETNRYRSAGESRLIVLNKSLGDLRIVTDY
jgi:hypothetical protein